MTTSANARAPERSPAARLVNGMVDLVPLPQAYVRLRELVDDPNTRLSEFGEIVASDPALTGRLLRLANSAYMGLVTPVESIEHAVRVIGMTQLHDIALATSAIGSLSKLRADLFDIYDFWRLGIYCAVCSRLLAVHCGLPSPQRSFVSGLMHNIGTLILAHEMPEAFAECRVRATAIERPYYELQLEMFGFDYAEVGAELMGHWNLPGALIEPVKLHTSAIANLDPDLRPGAAVLQIAATTARAALWESGESEPVPNYDAEAIAFTQMDAEHIEKMMTEADEEVIESVAILMQQP
ncbi:MAG: HDOD domain-containing protein [Gammaproteobacteria bacterium]|nr:HDOD domain-containing protein [Gammaproteobacteria bacterium]